MRSSGLSAPSLLISVPFSSGSRARRGVIHAYRSPILDFSPLLIGEPRAAYALIWLVGTFIIDFSPLLIGEPRAAWSNPCLPLSYTRFQSPSHRGAARGLCAHLACRHLHY